MGENLNGEPIHDPYAGKNPAPDSTSQFIHEEMNGINGVSIPIPQVLPVTLQYGAAFRFGFGAWQE